MTLIIPTINSFTHETVLLMLLPVESKDLKKIDLNWFL